MESYIGASLKFETISGFIEGRLKEIRKKDGVLIVEKDFRDDVLKEISINDIKSLEIIKKRADEAAKDPGVATTHQQKDTVTHEEAKEMLSDAFLCFYPTEDTFLSVVSHSVMKIVTNVFRCKAEDRIAILISGDDVFARLGYVLAMVMYNSNLSPDVHCTGHVSAKTAALAQRFTNNGYKISANPGQQYRLAICSSAESLNQVSYQSALFTDLPAECTDPGMKYGLVYGIKTDRVNAFSGRVFCIDVGFSDTFLKKYNLRRKYPSSVFCLPK